MIETFTTRLTQKIKLTSDVWQYEFELVSPGKLEFIAGQYLILKVPEKGQRNYSIASPSFEQKRFSLLVQMMPNGIASTYLLEANIGDEIIFQGPAGKFTLRENPREKIFLATGTGIAPMKSMIESYFQQSNNGTMEQSSNFYLFWGIRTREDDYLFDTFKSLAEKHREFVFKICLSKEDVSQLDSRYYAAGRVNPNLLKFLGVADEAQARLHRGLLNKYDYYLCGGRDAVESLRLYVTDLGIEKENIYFEKF